MFDFQRALRALVVLNPDMSDVLDSVDEKLVRWPMLSAIASGALFVYATISACSAGDTSPSLIMITFHTT
jgi:hypothetical protein